MKYKQIRRNEFITLISFLGLFLFLGSCKESEEEFALSAERMEIWVNEISDITVKGTDGFTLTLTNAGVVECVAEGNIIHVKGLEPGATSLIVAAADGLTKSCFIVVRERDEDTDYLNDDTARLEWNQATEYSEHIEGFAYTKQIGIDALGGTDNNTIGFDFSILGASDSYCRTSASGDFERVGSLSDGLIVAKRSSGVSYYKADRVVLKKINEAGQRFLIFYLPDNITVRVVTPVMQ